LETGVAAGDGGRCWHRRDFCSAKKWLNQTAPEHPRLVDEYSLASRLSYFLWSSMPDDELTGWPAKEHFAKISVRQVNGCWDPRSDALTKNFQRTMAADPRYCDRAD